MRFFRQHKKKLGRELVFLRPASIVSLSLVLSLLTFYLSLSLSLSLSLAQTFPNTTALRRFRQGRGVRICAGGGAGARRQRA